MSPNSTTNSSSEASQAEKQATLQHYVGDPEVRRASWQNRIKAPYFTAKPNRGHDALGGPRRWLLVAEENGAAADYGHMDLLLGEAAGKDVFGPLFEWLAER